MTLAKKIVININKDGTSTVSVAGTTGGGCLKATEKLEEDLGVVQDVKLTDDYYAALANKQQETLRN